MEFWHSVNGQVKLQIVSADNAHFLSELYKMGIGVEKVAFKDELTMQFYINRQDLKKTLRLADRKGVNCKITGKQGIFWLLYRLRKRPVLLCGLAFILVLNLFLPTRILFYRVEGNTNVPYRQIVALASEKGLEFGAVRRDVRSEKVKNAVLKAIPELEWVGINTSGCVATISVRERPSTSDNSSKEPVCNIVAIRDGIIQQIVVTSGNSLVQAGQEVKAGQVLISGYTDCGLSIRAERAKGEVYAKTEYSLTLVLPDHSAIYGEITAESEKIALIFGKKRTIFSQSSGILDTGCVKMYEENYVTLPGGFVLPVAIVTEKKIYHTPVQECASPESALIANAERYLKSQMVAGSIISKEELITHTDDKWILEGKYVCLEMIGREQREEIIIP